MTGMFPRRRLGRLLFGAAAPFPALIAVVGALVFASGAAATTVVESTAPFVYSATNPCTMEPFTGTGALHSLFSSNVSAGGMVQSHEEFNLQGMKAMTVTGKKYVVVDTSNETFVFDTPDLAPFHTKMERTVHFVRQGEDGTFVDGDDFYEHVIAHATVNANGVVTVDDINTNEDPCT
jgi:hypothetical protein